MMICLIKELFDGKVESSSESSVMAPAGRQHPVRLGFWSWLACPMDGRKVSGELIIPAMLHSVTAKISMWNELEWNSGGRRCAN